MRVRSRHSAYILQCARTVVWIPRPPPHSFRSHSSLLQPASWPPTTSQATLSFPSSCVPGTQPSGISYNLPSFAWLFSRNKIFFIWLLWWLASPHSLGLILNRGLPRPFSKVGPSVRLSHSHYFFQSSNLQYLIHWFIYECSLKPWTRL